MASKPPAYYKQKARNWMRFSGISDIKNAKAIIKSAIALCPDGNDLSSISISTVDKSIELTPGMREKAKEILKGLKMLEEA